MSDPSLGTALAAVAMRIVELEDRYAGGDPRVLFSRVITPETAPDYASLVNRAAFAVLAAAARDRADALDITSGDEAA